MSTTLDIGTLDFWRQPMEVRDETFAKLRAEQPISWHDPPEHVLGVGEEGTAPY